MILRKSFLEQKLFLMSRIPTVSARRLIKVLKKSGFIHDHTEGSHYIFYHPRKKIAVSVPVHKGRDLGRGITQDRKSNFKIEISWSDDI